MYEIVEHECRLIMSLYYIRTHFTLILFRNEFVSELTTGILVRRRKHSYYFVGEEPSFS